MNMACIDLFCGVGGLSHGFIKEGINVVAGLDMDIACKYPYEQNNSAKFLHEDVAKIRKNDLDELFGLSDIKILAGCAPCQPFSTYSQRYDQKRDKKWSLLNEFLRLIWASRPNVVTMENVPNLVEECIFKDFIFELEKTGYKVWYDVVDSWKYNVPQTRRRLVLLASLYGDIELVEPQTRKPRTVRQAIGKLRPLEAGEADPIDPLHVCSSLSPQNLERIRHSKPGGTWKDWPESLVVDCHKRASGRTYSGVYGRMEWDKPAPTMTTQCYGYGNGRFGHPEQCRAISLREAAILQSFPRNYKFVRSGENVRFKTIGTLIGNAVPVNLAKAIARSIKEHVQAEA